MKYISTFLVAVFCSGFVVIDIAWTQVTAPVRLYLQSQPSFAQTGYITKESIAGVRLKSKSGIIPADDIIDIDYAERIPTASIRIIYSNALTTEKTANKSVTKEKREEYLAEAVSKYQEALTKMPQNLVAARRHAEYKLAALTGVLGLETDSQAQRLLAVKKLNEFKMKHPDSWQYTSVMQRLMELHAAQNSFDEVRAVFEELSQSKASQSSKNQGHYFLIRLMMDKGQQLVEQARTALEKKNTVAAQSAQAEAEKQFGAAQKEVKALLAQPLKDDSLKLQLQLAQAQCKAGRSNPKLRDEASEELEELLQQTKGKKELRSVVYNTLGQIYFDNDELQKARWKFLWVEVIYNEDKEEHAKALYYLWRIFNRLNDPERGQEFLQQLVDNPRFVGTAYRAKAMEKKQ